MGYDRPGHIMLLYPFWSPVKRNHSSRKPDDIPLRHAIVNTALECKVEWNVCSCIILAASGAFQRNSLLVLKNRAPFRYKNNPTIIDLILAHSPAPEPQPIRNISAKSSPSQSSPFRTYQPHHAFPKNAGHPPHPTTHSVLLIGIINT